MSTQTYETVRDYYENGAPKAVKDVIESSPSKEVLDSEYPYRARMNKKQYEADLEALQIQLVRMQHDLARTGQRIVVLFEGRDAAGKGGTIKRFAINLNPRSAHIVALSKPTSVEAGEWYFQRYVQHLPTAGHISFFDRSWYNRGVVEPVFGFCTNEERDEFFSQAPRFEKILVDDGVILVKIWLTVSRAAQLKRFLDRESDPLKSWKLSRIDIDGLTKWDEYTNAIDLMLERSHHDAAPWHIIRSDDKRRARLEAIRLLLRQVDYDGRDMSILGTDHNILYNPG